MQKSNRDPRWIPVVGLMSGTSADGIDAALVYTDGQTVEPTELALTHPYRQQTSDAIWQAVQDPGLLDNPDFGSKLSQCITEDHAEAVRQLLAGQSIQPVLIGLHGQTIYHRPLEGLTLQSGDGQWLAETLKIDTVFNFRQADMDAGGQGAPLAPIYHRELLQRQSIELPAVFVNIGGIANLSACTTETLIGFDTGPGNCLMDDYMSSHFNVRFDAGGELAQSGQIDVHLLSRFMADPYFLLPGPKSLDRQAFSSLLDDRALLNLSAADAMATLCAVTVQAIKVSIDSLAEDIRTVVVAGGGQHNQCLMQGLEHKLDCPVTSADAIGLAGDYIEAELMAFLAARSLYQLPLTYPGTTGVSEPLCGGQLVLAGARV